jgi:hypothetical protein
VEGLKEVDIGQQLKEIIGPEVEFRSQQERALQAIMKRGQHSIGHYGDQRKVEDIIPIAHP